ncbi:urea carboxylase [Prosthecobacter fusiformis]|uniref:Urea carboxylase n=1 Tax=Prosthecobacter fusiformis TaxID=48464 RepID=A0A4R7RR86_9BACT|nr:urea carboxylase [Prosthecobacter fusiformis]TDU67325.1 urea carboxylase [Prosthecobacter fusiformis]
MSTDHRPIAKVLIANRGEIACRIIRTLKKMGLRSVAVYSEADHDSPHVSLADESYLLGPAPVAESYINQAKLLEVAALSGADAVHPGYGLLSENSGFAEACEKAGMSFMGPTPEQMRAFGLKHTARERALACNVPLVPGSDLLKDAEEAVSEAARIGFPVMLKSTAGGGGIGMRRCDDEDSLRAAFESVVRQGKSSFGDGGVFVEKLVLNARHVEVQIFGDGKGTVVALGERDCSTQRRNQKIIEETPAPNLSDETRQALWSSAVRLGQSVNYRSAGTVEFVYDTDTHEFYFLEVNTRLQVEHTVTEAVTGLDLVEWMVRTASGEDFGLSDYVFSPRGSAIQVRVYAEDPHKDFQPSCGRMTEVTLPADARCDGWISTGTEVTPYYDPLLTKIIVHAPDRAAAVIKMQQVLDATRLSGIETNLAYLRQVIRDPLFTEGCITTRALATKFHYQPATIDVLAPGVQTTVQDFPGRIGYWEIGVPPSGAMDPLALRIANRLVGNEESIAGLEITLAGPTLRFNAATTICLTGAALSAEVDGTPIPFWQPVTLNAGQTLKLGRVTAQGCRAYLAVQGGLDVPLYLGSRSTFTLGNFGGHAGRALRVGDVLHLGKTTFTAAPVSLAAVHPFALPEAMPDAQGRMAIRVIYGPHGAPDFFTPQDIETFFSTEWEVHYNSARTGVRLIGPKPQWARTDGGEAGLHPSNIHDNAYAIGSIDFTGDMPIILGPDGPSLGGFVCPAVVAHADLWKIGQLKPGDRVTFVSITLDEAESLSDEIEQSLLGHSSPPVSAQHHVPASAIRRHIPATDVRPDIVFRPTGDRHLLIEFGPLVLDIALRFWVHAVYLKLQDLAHPGIIDLTPGIRSLQIHVDGKSLRLAQAEQLITSLIESLDDVEHLEVPSRIIHLPLSWDDPQTQLAIDKYMQSVRPDAPWCPSNIEFIRRINGLESIAEVQRIVFDASYLVLGLGDVYLGAPVATPLDPRHRLVTTKYNPARTWTPENAVGIGGAYMCIYGMEGPGGYQFVGRTIQMWNRDRVTDVFEAGKPWLLRFFDQVRFYLVSAEELMELRRDFPAGRYTPRIEPSSFKLSDYLDFLETEATDIENFRRMQREAFAAERERWRIAGLDVTESATGNGSIEAEVIIPDGQEAVVSPVSGSLWKMLVKAGDRIEEGQALLIIEAMKMEIPVTSTMSGTVAALHVKDSQSVTPGQTLLTVIA